MSLSLAFPVAVIPVAVLALLLLSGCTAFDEPTTTPDAQPTSASPTPTVPYEPPADDASQLGIAVLVGGDVPQVDMETGPELMRAGATVVLRGECIGESVDYVVWTADATIEQSALIEGTLQCTDPVESAFEYETGYAGPVQVAFTDTERVEQAWVQLVQQ